MSVPDPGLTHATVTMDLPGGLDAFAYVTRGPILAAAGDRACLAHPRWFTREEAAQMIQALQAFIDWPGRG